MSLVPLPETPIVSPPEPLKRQLSLVALWLLVINGMIGAGIFGVPAKAEAAAGAFSPWLFVLCGVLIAPIMLCFVQLSSAFAGTGGPVLYTRAAYGPFAGFQIGWAFYIARLTAFAANLNLLVVTIGYFWATTAAGDGVIDSGGAESAGGGMGPAVRVALLLACCGLFVWVNIVGAKTAMRSLGVLTILKLLPLVALAGLGVTYLDTEVFTAVGDPPGLGDLGAAVLLVIYAYVGFESGLVPAGESKRPQRDMPIALLLALVVATTVYVLVQVATQRLVPELALSERPIVDAGQALLGGAGAVLIVLAIIASVGGNLLGSMFSTPRITYRLALDGQLPKPFASVHSKHGTPWVSVAVYGGAAFVLAATGSFVYLAVLSVFTRLLIYMTCIASMPRVNAIAAGDITAEDLAFEDTTAPDSSDASPDQASSPAPHPIRLPGGWAIPIIAMLVCVGLLTRVSPSSVLVTLAMLAVGTVLYQIAARRGNGSNPNDDPDPPRPPGAQPPGEHVG